MLGRSVFPQPCS